MEVVENRKKRHLDIFLKKKKIQFPTFDLVQEGLGGTEKKNKTGKKKLLEIIL